MKKTSRKLRLLAALLLCVMTVSVLTLAVGAAFPKPIDYIADQAGKLSESTIRQIRKTNEQLLDQVGCTVSVCTVLTTGDVSPRDYAHDLFLDWKLGEGVLILIASDDKQYFLLQSSGVDKVLTPETLESIRDEYLEENFEAGNIDRGVLQCATKIAQILFSDYKADAAADAPAAQDNKAASSEPAAEKKTTVGSVIVGFFKAILYLILIAAVLFIVFFVYAMFNDDAAQILQKYVFQRGNQQKMPEQYYDERLYGTPNRQTRSRDGQRRPNGSYPQNGQRRPNPSGYSRNTQANPYQQGNPYPQQQNPYQRSNPAPQQQNPYPQGNPYQRVNSAPQQNPYPQGNPYQQQSRQTVQTPYADDSATRAYTIPGRGQNGR